MICNEIIEIVGIFTQILANEVNETECLVMMVCLKWREGGVWLWLANISKETGRLRLTIILGWSMRKQEMKKNALEWRESRPMRRLQITQRERMRDDER